jgi:hypothetical protein
MFIREFDQLDLDSKLCLIWKDGILLGHRAEKAEYMSLYSFSGFYVELHYHNCFDGVVQIKSFMCEEELDPYLEQIDLNEIQQILRTW